ncbi:uncharacterized protein LOC113512958 [Galleria mellonella]|uniref:Uncharacterized protein LOC113512958 n=1 Tax=Galleria mellonella TaxID=7137 RepID=A0A6J1WNA2_GALME|nr:uncharacterized protein LOC113512958 [Galleria mellonella]
MSRVSAPQMKILLDLLSQEGVLVHGKVSYANTTKLNFWKRIATQLNAVEGGVYKNTWKWCKMWADWKNKTKKKANILLRRKSYNFAHPTPTLTNLELRLLKMVDYPIDDKSDAMKLEMGINKVELPEISDDVQGEYLIDEYNESQPSKSRMSSDGDIAPECFDTTESKFCNVDDIISDDSTNFKKYEESSDTEKKVKWKGKTFKKKKSLHEYKLKTALMLEKQRVQHKTEELRLRALELKLKGEELRLKEMEMNKINYLTNIEEEKLKCFRDISASLKELVERTKNGNIRFPSII